MAVEPLTQSPLARAARASYALRLGSFTIPWLPAALVLVGAGIVSTSPIVADSWLALVGGREVWRHGLPSYDSLSTLGMGRPWIDQAWLGQVVFYGIYSAGGLAAVMVVSRLAITLSQLLALATAARRRSSPLAILIALVAASILLSTCSEVRLQLLAEPLFALLLWVLCDDVRVPARRTLWSVPLILVVWANVHGSVLLGSGLVLLAAAIPAVRALRTRSTAGLGRVGWLVAVALASPFGSPYGPRLLDYYRSVLANPAFGRFLTEWQHSTPRSAPIACAAIAATLLLAAARWRRTHLFDLLVLLATAVATVQAQRNVVWFAFAVAALVPPLLDGVLPDCLRVDELRGAVSLFAGAALVALVLLVRVAGASDGELATRFPASAAALERVAAGHPQSQVLASTGLSDWLLFEEPSLSGRIVADGRFEVLRSRDFVRLQADLAGASPTIAFPRARILALSPDSPLARAALALPGARRVAREPRLVAIALPGPA